MLKEKNPVTWNPCSGRKVIIRNFFLVGLDVTFSKNLMAIIINLFKQ